MYSHWSLFCSFESLLWWQKIVAPQLTFHYDAHNCFCRNGFIVTFSMSSGNVASINAPYKWFISFLERSKWNTRMKINSSLLEIIVNLAYSNFLIDSVQVSSLNSIFSWSTTHFPIRDWGYITGANPTYSFG